MTDNKTGTALRAIRQAAGMTLQEVADNAGVSVSYLSRVETGQQSATSAWVAMVAIALGDGLAAAAAEDAA